ncbi:hypothetical protein [Spirosoma sp. KUDC1026]|uniref:hypothetical protein n=1 Tax=Spirosoma sp. KUDC1026 TaxID=2745947 RepID=UPI00159B99FA|nr:hypothetical protein [Spirosoma sp. KUDC1026]QKZ15187.1 hypothetical protein HU175_22200 [Spirosoma sp. KUDC1026]
MITDEIIILRNGKTITSEELVMLIAGELVKQGYVITKPDQPATEPVKPVDPVVLPPAEEVDILTADEIALLGNKVGDNLYEGVDQDVRYLVAEGKLWPKSTPTNQRTNEDGDWAVPASYRLPAGWGWRLAKDGAYAIVPFPTKQPGPPWLTPDQPATDAKEITEWEFDQNQTN